MLYFVFAIAKKIPTACRENDTTLKKIPTIVRMTWCLKKDSHALRENDTIGIDYFLSLLYNDAIGL